MNLIVRRVLRSSALCIAACGGDGTNDVPPDGSIDGAVLTCGNGVRDDGEACDLATPTTCSDLGGTWSGGMATCRSDCMGWDVAACVRVDASRWETVEPAIRDPLWAFARCNDGTPFDFDIQLAPQPSKTWVIHLAGGQMCDDLAKPCSERERRLTTTSPGVDRAMSSMSSMSSGGIFSRSATANPTFATANLVRATYCSSDLWAGSTIERRPSSGDPINGWYFSGHANVAAMLDVIKQRYGLDDDDPDTEVLFAGSSAGALGAHFNAALAEAAFPGSATRRQLRLLIDAGWMFYWVDPDPAPPDYFTGIATVPDDAMWEHAREFWGATFDPSCEAAVADPWSCLYGPVWYPHVSARLPTLVQQSSIDAAFTETHGIAATPSPALAAWKQTAEQSLTGVSWLFSGDASYHVLVGTDAGLSRGPAGSTLRAVIGRFWGDGPSERVEF
jgi:O-palmitoleoyl-L-serine hydrolase